MAKKRTTKKVEEPVVEATPVEDLTYRSAVCGLGNAVGAANELDKEGYAVHYCFAVVANDQDGKPTQAVYILAKKKDA